MSLFKICAFALALSSLHNGTLALCYGVAFCRLYNVISLLPQNRLCMQHKLSMTRCTDTAYIGIKGSDDTNMFSNYPKSAITLQFR